MYFPADAGLLACRAQAILGTYVRFAMLSALRGSWFSWGVLAVATACTLTDPWEPTVVGPANEAGTGGSRPGESSGGNGSTPNVGGGVGLGGTNQAGAGGAGNAGGGGTAGSVGLPTDAGLIEPDASEPVTCPGLTFGASCYEFVAQAVTWDIAEAACAQRNANLASVETLAEDTFLDVWPQTLGIPANNGAGIWLGATDALADNDFRWPDNTPLTFNRWGTNQPDNGGAAPDCVEKRNDGTGQWFDQRCTDVKVFVCEKEL
jgi:hypothetical protein